MVRFVVGHSADAQQERLMNAEQEKHRDLLRLPTTVRPPPAPWNLGCTGLNPESAALRGSKGRGRRVALC